MDRVRVEKFIFSRNVQVMKLTNRTDEIWQRPFKIKQKTTYNSVFRLGEIEPESSPKDNGYIAYILTTYLQKKT